MHSLAAVFWPSSPKQMPKGELSLQIPHHFARAGLDGRAGLTWRSVCSSNYLACDSSEM